MIYENHFSTDWTHLTRDEAMVRAFALGIASAFDETHPEEFERLLTQEKRIFIEMAFNEGKRKALKLDAAYDADEDDRDDSSGRGYDVMDQLLVYQGAKAEQEPVSSHFERQLDVPATIERTGLLDLKHDHLKRLGLPDFLYR